MKRATRAGTTFDGHTLATTTLTQLASSYE